MRPSGRTVRDLARSEEQIPGFTELSTIVARDDTRLDVLASDADPRVSEAFSDEDYRDVAALAAHFYSIVLTDTGTGIVHSVMDATLSLADTLVVVSGLSVDEARLASETLTWLETNGYAEQAAGGAIVVLNNAVPGSRSCVSTNSRRTSARGWPRSYGCRTTRRSHPAQHDLVRRPSARATRAAARQLAATVVEGLRSAR